MSNSEIILRYREFSRSFNWNISSWNCTYSIVKSISLIAWSTITCYRIPSLAQITNIHTLSIDSYLPKIASLSLSWISNNTIRIADHISLVTWCASCSNWIPSLALVADIHTLVINQYLSKSTSIFGSDSWVSNNTFTAINETVSSITWSTITCKWVPCFTLITYIHTFAIFPYLPKVADPWAWSSSFNDAFPILELIAIIAWCAFTCCWIPSLALITYRNALPINEDITKIA